MANEHHNHHHHHHAPDLKEAGALKGVYIISIVLNLSFVFVEAGIGLWKGSLGLLSDAGHNLGDVFSLLLALIAFKLSATKPNERFTYGYRKGSVLISLLNAIILLVAVGAILLESIHKFANPAPVDGSAIAWTAAAGIVVNGFTAFLLMRHQKNDINTRGAFPAHGCRYSRFCGRCYIGYCYFADRVDSYRSYRQYYHCRGYTCEYLAVAFRERAHEHRCRARKCKAFRGDCRDARSKGGQ